VSYDFANLSPDDFQLLVRDLLQVELGILLETFTSGADKGIDLRNVDKRRKLLVVQCKRFSEARVLERVMERSELQKVRKLNPSRYILATSAPLNPQRKGRLLRILQPYCAQPGDILGREDLNNLIQRHPEAERRHFKLWLDSALLLDRVLNLDRAPHDGAFGDDDSAVARARTKLRRYVANPSLDRAVQLLESERYCIIAGQPGIGKTTLAEILMLDHVERQGFHAVKISSSLEEIRTRRSPKQQLFFYFDDFLGQTLIEQTVRNEDRRLVEFIEDVRANPKWRFVLTTREYVYNQGVLKYEGLANAAEHMKKCIINLSDYTPLIRGRILYNHLYYSALPQEYLEALVTDCRYFDIIKHHNYNPRIVEYMTSDIVIANTSATDYSDDFIRNLDTPNRIWHHAFHRHLSLGAQDLLLVLATFPGEALLTDVSIVFTDFHRLRSRRLLTSISHRALNDALQELDGDFISTSREKSTHLVDFSNPSIRDFLHATLNDDAATVCDLVVSSRYFEQLTRLWRLRHDSVPAPDYLGEVRAFESALESLLESDSPVLSYTYASRRTLKRALPSTSERILTVMEVAEELRTPRLARLVKRFIEPEGDAEFDMSAYDKWGLIAVLTRLRNRSTWKANDSKLFSLTQSFLLETLDSVDDFKAIAEFRRLFPTAFSAIEWVQVERQLTSSSEDWQSEARSDEDDLWGLHSEVEELVAAFPTVAPAIARELRDRAMEFERETEQDLSTPYKAAPTPSSDDSAEIRALFESLLTR
jgi:hypothetical protein